MDAPDGSGLKKKLEDSMLLSAMNSLEYLPRDAIRSLLTRDNIVAELEKTSLSQPSAVADEVMEAAIKVFAVLVLIDASDMIETLLDVGMNDQCLPVEDGNNRCNNAHRKDAIGHNADCLQFLDSTVAARFRQSQWVLQAWVLDSRNLAEASKQTTVYAHCPIPALEWESIPSLEGGQHVEEVAMVFRGKIHHAHHLLPEYSGQSLAVTVSRRSTTRLSPDAIHALETYDSIQNPHLATPIDILKFRDEKYVIYSAMKRRNLFDLWTTHPNAYGMKDAPSPTKYEKLVDWALSQMKGLTWAVLSIHNINPDLIYIDIDPRNILRSSESSSLDTLQLNTTPRVDLCTEPLDMMSHTVSRDPQRPYKIQLRPLEPDPRYKAPGLPINTHRAPNTATSWAMGCVILEFIIWLVFGPLDLRSFTIATVSSFCNESSESSPIQLSKPVQDIIERLRHRLRQKENRMESFEKLGRLLTFVRLRLLVSNNTSSHPEKRADTSELFLFLRDIIDTKAAVFEDGVGDLSFKSPALGDSQGSPSFARNYVRAKAPASANPRSTIDITSGLMETSLDSKALIYCLIEDMEAVDLYIKAWRKMSTDCFRSNHDSLLHAFLGSLSIEGKLGTSSDFELKSILYDRRRIEEITDEMWLIISNARLDPSDSVTSLLHRRDCLELQKNGTEIWSYLAHSEAHVNFTNRLSETLKNAPSFNEFKGSFRNLLHAPNRLQSALSSLNQNVVRRCLRLRDVSLADEFDWIEELRDLGCRNINIAQILLQQKKDSPWIIFSREPFTPRQLQVGVHIPGCIHRFDGTQQDSSNSSTDRNLELHTISQAEHNAHALCSLAGVVPFSSDRSLWAGSVDFSGQENRRAAISYSLPSETVGTDEHCSTILPILAEVATALSEALSCIQTKGLCCDSFTALCHTTGQAISMTRINFAVVEELSQFISAWPWKDPVLLSPGSTALDSRAEHIAHILSNIFEPMSTGPHSILTGLELSQLKNQAVTLHYCCLGMQMLCLAFLSYSKAHLGPLHPFFLESPLHSVALYGIELPPHRQHWAIEARLFQLSCLDEMLQSPVVVFCCIPADETPLDSSEGQRLQYDLLASAEDMIDTWGPGELIIGESGSVVGMMLRGGVISDAAPFNVGSTAAAAQFHWSPFRNEPPPLTKAFDPHQRISIGAKLMGPYTVAINPACSRDEHEWWLKSATHFKAMGTSAPYWARKEIQGGLQGGQYMIAQFNVAWEKVSGRTLKQHKLAGTDDLIMAFLEEPWGVQVSFCTGVCRRVTLRQLVADVFPVFAEATIFQSKLNSWKHLQNLSVPSFIESLSRSKMSATQYLRTLPEDHACYVVALTRHILDTMQHTGIDREGKHLTVAWPHVSDLEKCVQIKCHDDSSWLGFLADSEECATFAYMTTKCLETQTVKCPGSQSPWGKRTPVLGTAVLNLQSGSTPQTLLQHDEIYYLQKMDKLFFVRAQRPWTKLGPAELIVKSSRSPANFHGRLQVWRDQRLREENKRIRESTTVEIAFAEEVTVYSKTKRMVKEDHN